MANSSGPFVGLQVSNDEPVRGSFANRDHRATDPTAGRGFSADRFQVHRREHATSESEYFRVFGPDVMAVRHCELRGPRMAHSDSGHASRMPITRSRPNTQAWASSLFPRE
jgi:hypothetical protein